MNKLSAILSLFVLLAASSVMAGGITNKQNFSIEYDRTSSRNASNDSADAAVYNPAGVMQMEDAFYLNAGMFYAFKDYSNTIGGVKHKSDEPSLIPNLIGLYKKDRWAAFGAFTLNGGGGKVIYDNGSATTKESGENIIRGVNLLASFNAYDEISSQGLEAESIYYGLTFGGAYKVNDLVSVALGMRYIRADKESSASITISPSTIGALYGLSDRTFNIDYEETAEGFGGILGLNIAASEDLNLGMRYETGTRLDFKTSVNRDNTGMLDDGSRKREDLPGLIGIGAGYRINEDLKMDTSFTYYLEKEATRDDPRFDDVGNGYDFALAFEYAFNPELKASLGYMRTIVNLDADDMQPEAAELDANSFSGGISYALTPDLDLNFAVMKNIYESEKTTDGVELSKGLFCLAFGFQYKIY